MIEKAAAIRAQAAALRARFEAQGAVLVEPSILQSAETLLDLYGEEIRSRAYVTADPERGEMMLRPDFTVPVVEMHMAGGAEPARYTYAGKVFRRQEAHPERASEYVQVGYELFDRADPAAADAEVFSLVADAVAPLGLRAVTGDIGVLIAAVSGLETTKARRAALLRHLWRPGRFRALLNRYSGKTPPPPTRVALLAAADPFADAPPQSGKRSRAEIEARIAALRADAAAPPLAREQVALIDAVLSVRETLPYALERLRDIAVDLPALTQALDAFEARLEALGARGQDVDKIDFEGSYGRTSMEYYDGFVFGFVADPIANLPPVATGGRYDALTQRLGQGGHIRAVGAVIRPDLMIALSGKQP
ncbi:ATP phosphoribosyltransferase regulatory subunit [Cognatishimia sp. F0-27]|uniref:ATP phosphoribosyltransferase regulatory subunit n=1 Tax=Cognatishimia sp. F0-27 TaxID=2816855 RepID=UPI001D0CBBA2|nr:ATP phosphoribosyltransferase regulatory subunit [Cognatishimia sp. F0-27]MCC1493936.1 ATP phosphoribosyltransferase regulatory subunit [Cognatishimia sp. F0-27]